MRFLRYAIVLALLASPSVGSAQRAYWTQSIDAQQNCIADGGGLCILDFVETGSAVNEITITNAATGNDPTIASSGEGNIGLTLSSESAGGVVTILGTMLDIPSASSPSTTAEGHFVFDNAANLGSGNRDAIEFYNGVESAYLVYFTASDVPTNGQVVKFNTDGTMTWEDDISGGAPAWETISVPGGNQTLAMDTDTTTFDWLVTTDATIDAWVFAMDYTDAGTSNVRRLVTIRRDDSGGADGDIDVLLLISNADTDDLVDDGIEITQASGGVMTNGINFTPVGTMTTAIRLDDDQITNVFSTTAHGITEAELDIIGDGFIEGADGGGSPEILADSIDWADISATMNLDENTTMAYTDIDFSYLITNTTDTAQNGILIDSNQTTDGATANFDVLAITMLSNGDGPDSYEGIVISIEDGTQIVDAAIRVTSADTGQLLAAALIIEGATDSITVGIDASDDAILGAALAIGSNTITTGVGTITSVELDRLTGLAGIIVTDATAVTNLEGAALDIDTATLRVTPNAITATELATTITFADGDLLDFGEFISSATEGILLPKHATTCASATGEGQICWDAGDDSSNALWIGDGTVARNIGAGSSTTNIEVNLDEMFLLIPVTAGPQAELVGTNFVQEALAFDASTEESVYIRFVIDDDYSDSAITCDWMWETDNTALDACFCMESVDVLPNGTIDRDPADEETGACTSVTAAANANDVVTSTIVITQTHVGGNMFLARLFRNADESEANCAAGSDDLAVDARLLTGVCRYQVTL